ncbi:MAG: hypothetical protein WA395_09230 [Nitrososphaeraceae archaeon]
MPYVVAYIGILKLIHMSTEEQVIAKILTAGPLGIKKSELRKSFIGFDLDGLLHRLVTTGDVFIEKKGTSYYCWHKDHYLQSLLNSDPKFKLIYDSLRSLEKSLLNSTLSGSTPNETSEPEKLGNGPDTPAIIVAESESTDTAEFMREFDNAIAENSNSIGWVELEKIKRDLSSKHIYQRDDFYNQVKQLIEKNTERYELSTGGNEGIMIRGLLHGFVRCI